MIQRESSGHIIFGRQHCKARAKGGQRKKLVAFVLSILRKEKLPMSEELEKLKHKQYVAERKLTVAKHKEKWLQSELKQLTKSEKTHRLCTRAGLLETFSKEPVVLTDDVMELLTFIFQSEGVQEKLNLLIESRKKTKEMDENWQPYFETGRNYPPPKDNYVLPKAPAGSMMISPKVFCSIHPEEAMSLPCLNYSITSQTIPNEYSYPPYTFRH